jgi:hypothetical protein
MPTPSSLMVRVSLGLAATKADGYGRSVAMLYGIVHRFLRDAVQVGCGGVIVEQDGLLALEAAVDGK